MAERGAARSPKLPVQPLPMSWGRAVLEGSASGALGSLIGVLLALIGVFALGMPYEVAGVGSYEWNDLYPRNVLGGMMLWGAVMGSIAVALRLLARQHAVRLADRSADGHRPPAYERSALARSWIITLFWIVLALEVFVGGILLVIALVMLFSDPGTESLIFLAAVGIPVLAGVAFLVGGRRVLQPRWAARWENIRERWPATSAEPFLTRVPRASALTERVGWASSILFGLALISGLLSMILLTRRTWSSSGQEVETVSASAPGYATGIWLGIACGALLLLALLAFLVEQTLAALRRRTEFRRHLDGRADDAHDAAREALTAPPGSFLGLALTVISGALVPFALGADISLLDPTAAMRAEIAVVRWALVPAALFGVLGALILICGRHAKTRQQTDLLAAFPGIDPIPALAPGTSRTDSDKESFHRAGPDEEIDVEASLRRARDTAHVFGDVEG
ncbi:hypothetical protein Bequi_04905 [Brachybacterium sp. JHP9]|uniref:ABC transporter permease n=1 Tax=Brachybacterium equifaecis TaxID=2910770 RepID=A0ABT0QYJ8_9MICO|nr:hypothetical protein [Brachybacterium equifaecis]MCL6422731.1 hypothetical protein [Brachybacterium equifaecis]